MQIDLTPKTEVQRRTGLGIGIPFVYHREPNGTIKGRPVVPQWAISLAVQAWPLNMIQKWIAVEGYEIQDGRQYIAEESINRACEFLFMLDDDTAPPQSACRYMVNALRQNPDVMVCVAPVPTRTDPVEPNIFKYRYGGGFWDWSYGEVFEIAEAGAGCMLIRTEVFDRIEKPWFKYVQSESPIENVEGITTKNDVSEDIFFCRKVVDAGFKILAHGSTACWHYEVETGRCFRFPDRYYRPKK